MLGDQGDVRTIQTLKANIPIEEGGAQVIKIIGNNMPTSLKKSMLKSSGPGALSEGRCLTTESISSLRIGFTKKERILTGCIKVGK